jgi:hypothetical protein
VVGRRKCESVVRMRCLLEVCPRSVGHLQKYLASLVRSRQRCVKSCAEDLRNVYVPRLLALCGPCSHSAAHARTLRPMLASGRTLLGMERDSARGIPSRCASIDRRYGNALVTQGMQCGGLAATSGIALRCRLYIVRALAFQERGIP